MRLKHAVEVATGVSRALLQAIVAGTVILLRLSAFRGASQAICSRLAGRGARDPVSKLQGSPRRGKHMAEIIVRSNNIENILLGNLSARWSASGTRILRYYLDVRHAKMNLHRELSAPEIFILQSKTDALIAAWDEKFVQFQIRQTLQSGKESAEELTATAMARLDGLQRILARTLTVNDAVDWEALKDRNFYPMPKSYSPAKPKFAESEPPAWVAPAISFWSKLTGKAAEINEKASTRHREAVAEWQGQEAGRKAQHQQDAAKWLIQYDAFWAAQERAKQAFLDQQTVTNAKVDALRNALAVGDDEAIIEHATLVLEASDYDGLFEKSYVIQYHPAEKLLMLGYDLPSPDVLPTIKTVKFVKATGELKETHISEREQKANFEAVAYQVCLRTLHELFEADGDGNFSKILFNGFVGFVDRRTGQEARSCLVSVLVDRETFGAIDLSRVDPKACFKTLRGVSAASLASLTAIPPVMELDKEDRRFIEAREIGEGMQEGMNLASMSWEDFEHLVRELFEHEFRSRNGEVRVTRSSSDGGVDAIAFDPDPISGGKIVIQAKRYTRTVGVSAVRDLFGTVMNEGASKGILVTTADYGPDAYQFANGKPLTLLNGANLLHMMKRHGYKARIDIREARAELA